MALKLKFDRSAGTCTEIVLYPSHPAKRLLKHLKAEGFRARSNFRGVEEGCTITLREAAWQDAIAAVEAFFGRRVYRGRERRRPPESLYVPAAEEESP